VASVVVLLVLVVRVLEAKLVALDHRLLGAHRLAAVYRQPASAAQALVALALAALALAAQALVALAVTDPASATLVLSCLGSERYHHRRDAFVAMNAVAVYDDHKRNDACSAVFAFAVDAFAFFAFNTQKTKDEQQRLLFLNNAFCYAHKVTNQSNA
jgi:hypothetical protein